MPTKEKKAIRKPQSQNRPGAEYKMKPEPVYDYPNKPGSGRLAGKKAFITGGDSGIGRAVAILFAKEGADVAIVYLSETKDAELVKKEVEETYGRKCLLLAGDLSKEAFCTKAVSRAIKAMGSIDILVNNAGIHYESKSLGEISTAQLMQTFATNVFSMFWVTKAVLENMKEGSCIINTTSVTAYRGSKDLIDYASTKSAIVGFTRSLAANLVDRGIRVNGVAPGPIWTPLIAASFKPARVASHGSSVPMKRAGEPVEVAPAYLYLATDDSSYVTGQVLHVNGGEILNG